MNAVGSDWAQLFRIACSLIRQVNSEHVIIDTWSFGGGTAMMLQIDHRRSDDIDIFLQDPRLLPYLDPKLHDFEFEVMPSDYRATARTSSSWRSTVSAKSTSSSPQQ